MIAAACLILACGHRDEPPAPPPGASRTERWRYDLGVLACELPARHKNAFFHIPEVEWRRDVDELSRRVDELDDAHITAGIVRLVAEIGDPHTQVYPARHGVYPLMFDWFSDGIFVTGADQRWAVGQRLVGIGAHPVADVIAALRPLVSHDSEQNIRAWLPLLLVDPVRLAGTDLADPDHAVFQLAADDGSVRALEVRPGEPVHHALFTRRPLYLEHAGERSYWSTYVDADHLLYVAYESCSEDPRVGPFVEFATASLALADSHPVDRVVIDLRANGGGDGSVIAPLIDGLAARPALAGRLFVAIGMHTFSSANQNAMELKRRLLATLVGGTTGARSSGYGEVQQLTLPASRLQLQYSTRYFTNPGYPSDTVDPDLPVEITSRDYFAGRDPILEAIRAVPLPPRTWR